MKARIRRDILSGLVVIAPIVATLYVARWIYLRLTALPGMQYLRVTDVPIVNDFIQLIVAFLVIVFILAGAGSLIRTTIGVYVQNELDRFANRIPGLRLIYNATKLAIEAMVGETDKLQKPVKVEMGKFRLTGFKTGGEASDGRQFVFIPTSPNITSGIVAELEPEEILDTDESVQDALTRVLSAGFGETSDSEVIPTFSAASSDEDNRDEETED